MSVGGDQIRPESLIKCSGIGDQVTSESLIKCFRNQRSNAAGIGDHFAPEYTVENKNALQYGVFTPKAFKFFGQILGTFSKILGTFWVIFEPTENHKRQPYQPENWI